MCIILQLFNYQSIQSQSCHDIYLFQQGYIVFNSFIKSQIRMTGGSDDSIALQHDLTSKLGRSLDPHMLLMMLESHSRNVLSFFFTDFWFENNKNNT